MSARDSAPAIRMVACVCGHVGANSAPFRALVGGMRGKAPLGQNVIEMSLEPLSPELALVDPDLGTRARAALPSHPWPAPVRAPRPAPVPAAVVQVTERVEVRRTYPVWARVTAALWLVVIGILIGGAAIPHAQDRPRLVPPDEDVPAAICEQPQATTPSTVLP
jgi:hypothetical protein